MLQTANLTCRRGNRRLFRDLNLSLDAGELLWVGGRNGSGKTSLLRLLAGLARPDSGDIRWCAQSIAADNEAFRRELLYLGHLPAVKDDLSALENLRFALALDSRNEPDATLCEALARFGLGGRENLPVRSLSQGQRRRAALARLAFAASSRLWILDEPFTALDTAAIDVVLAALRGHLGSGGCAVLTSHQPVDVEGLAVRRLALDA